MFLYWIFQKKEQENLRCTGLAKPCFSSQISSFPLDSLFLTTVLVVRASIHALKTKIQRIWVRNEFIKVHEGHIIWAGVEFTAGPHLSCTSMGHADFAAQVSPKKSYLVWMLPFHQSLFSTFQVGEILMEMKLPVTEVPRSRRTTLLTASKEVSVASLFSPIVCWSLKV